MGTMQRRKRLAKLSAEFLSDCGLHIPRKPSRRFKEFCATFPVPSRVLFGEIMDDADMLPQKPARYAESWARIGKDGAVESTPWVLKTWL
jgi:hypothetical protein